MTALPAHAWTFSPSPVCTLSHATASAEISITYDPMLDVPYALSATRAAPWPEATIFALTFQGPNGFTITTNRHGLSADGLTLRVEDTGFGNVLNGLEFNAVATALLGEVSERFPLDDAAPAVRAFRACPAPAVS